MFLTHYFQKILFYNNEYNAYNMTPSFHLTNANLFVILGFSVILLVIFGKI